LSQRWLRRESRFFFFHFIKCRQFTIKSFPLPTEMLSLISKFEYTESLDAMSMWMFSLISVTSRWIWTKKSAFGFPKNSIRKWLQEILWMFSKMQPRTCFFCSAWDVHSNIWLGWVHSAQQIVVFIKLHLHIFVCIHTPKNSMNLLIL
jgi:hypothetical protein